MKLMMEALQAAQRVLADHLEPRPPRPKAFDTTTQGYWQERANAADGVINELLGILDNKALVEEQRDCEMLNGNNVYTAAVRTLVSSGYTYSLGAEQWKPPQGPAVMDPNVSNVRKLLLDRSAVGIKKYGVTTAGANLDLSQWLQHLQEELCDAAVYVEAIKSGASPVKELEDRVRNLEARLYTSERLRAEALQSHNKLRDKLIDAQAYIRNIKAE